MLNTEEDVLKTREMESNKYKTKIVVCGDMDQAKFEIKLGDKLLEQSEEINR